MKHISNVFAACKVVSNIESVVLTDQKMFFVFVIETASSS